MPLPPISDKASVCSPVIGSEKSDKLVREGICEKICVAELDQAWVFEGNSANQSRIIITGIKHDFRASN